MMAEYIDREAAVKAFNNFDAGRADSPPFTLLTPEEFAEYLYELPTADVAPVVHGKWYLLDDCANAGMYCSVCSRRVHREEFAYKKLRSKYCPHCGAKMDGGNGNG